MAVTNKLQVYFDHAKIDAAFDFYQMTTSDKYISRGAYLLDKPVASLKARSLVFDYGRTAFVMFSSGSISRTQFVESIGQENISIKRVYSSDIKDYILFRLFLFSLGNYRSEDNIFNNLTGKLYINRPGWSKSRGKVLMALAVDVDQDLCLSVEATSFTDVTAFNKNSKVTKGLAKYILGQNGKLRRVLESDSGQQVFVKRGVPGRKAEYPFFSLSEGKSKETKAWYFYKVLDDLKKRYAEFLRVSQYEISLSERIGTRRDSDFVEKALEIVTKRSIAAINWSEDPLYDAAFSDLRRSLEGRIGKEISIKTSPSFESLNLVLLHERDYYSKAEKDPYAEIDRRCAVQCVTVEETMDKVIDQKEAVINTLVKELAIKADIQDSVIRMDDWSTFGFKSDWYFGTQVDKSFAFMRVSPDGKISFYEPDPLYGHFSEETINALVKLADDSKAKGKTIISDALGNVILISRTGEYCLPSPAVFDLKTVSRSKESREAYLEGVVDINLFEADGECFYCAGIVGAGMQTAIPKASLLYRVECLKGNNVIEALLETMSVMFVKYNSFTVLPYPVKYLREYIASTKQIKE